MFSELFNDSLIEELKKGIDNYMDIYKLTLPKVIKFKRRYRFNKNKFRIQYVTRKNLLNDLLISPNLLLRPLINSGGRIWIRKNI